MKTAERHHSESCALLMQSIAPSRLCGADCRWSYALALKADQLRIDIFGTRRKMKFGEHILRAWKRLGFLINHIRPPWGSLALVMAQLSLPPDASNAERLRYVAELDMDLAALSTLATTCVYLHTHLRPLALERTEAELKRLASRLPDLSVCCETPLSQFRMLNAAYRCVSADDCALLVHALRHSCGLTSDSVKLEPDKQQIFYLFLDGNPLGSRGARCIARGLLSQPLRSLTELRLRDCNLGNAGCESLFTSACILHACERLFLGGNGADRALHILAAALMRLKKPQRQSIKLVFLDMSKNSITDEGLIALVRSMQALEDFPQIPELLLTSNVFGERGREALRSMELSQVHI